MFLLFYLETRLQTFYYNYKNEISLIIKIIYLNFFIYHFYDDIKDMMLVFLVVIFCAFFIKEQVGINTERLEELKYKNKLIILDNASSHRNDTIRTLIGEHGGRDKVLCAVPYQHFTNAIENFFSVFKSRLQKKVGISYSELKENIKETLNSMPSQIFKRIFQGLYERDEKYKRKSRKR